MHLLTRIGFLLALLTLPFIAQAQITISGAVKDSTHFVPLPYVSISVSGKVAAISNEQGLFELQCNVGDTIWFSRVGFKKTKLIPLEKAKNASVIMSESTTLLHSITIYGNYKPQGQAQWRRYVILPKIFENPTMKDPNGMVQTFGPGVSIPGVLSYFNSENREKRKIKKATDELVATQIYREVMSSEKVKADLIELFSITEDLYFKKIESFNIQHPDAAYLKNRSEIINLLIGFFALKEK
jgi:hypothetical protein